MSPRTIILGIIGAALMLTLVLELVRRRRLRIGYSLLWLLVGASGLILILFPDLLGFSAGLLGIQSPTSLLFTAGIAFALLILLEHSLTLTVLWRQNKDMAQNQALLEWQIRRLQHDLHKADRQLAGLRSEMAVEEPQPPEPIPFWARFALADRATTPEYATNWYMIQSQSAQASWEHSGDLAIQSEKHVYD